MPMKKYFREIFALCFLCTCVSLSGQLVPEVLYYDFNGTGTTVPNLASAPPPGTANGTINGGITLGSSGLCSGALIGSGLSSNTDYFNTGWAPNLGTGSWTISFRTNNVNGTTTTYYVFSEANTSSLRCFTNGVAGANNWLLRGAGITDVLATGGAQTSATMTTFVYDNTLNNIKAYVNGVLVNTVAQTAPTLTGPGPFKIMGYTTNLGMNAGGELDEFRVYSHALSATDVSTLYGGFVYYGFLGSDISFCTPETVLLATGHPYSYTNWSTTETNDSIYVSTGGQITVSFWSMCESGYDTIMLTQNNPSSSTLNVNSCTGSYTAPSGAVYTASGIYMDTIPNAGGCDSVITINLNVGNNTSSTLNPTVCNSYTSPSGNLYTSSGTYIDTIPNSSGCDSVITINLSLNGVETMSSFTAYGCGVYVSPGADTIMASGTHMDTIPNVAGCDSIMTIQVIIYGPTSSSISAAACDTYFSPGGNMYTSTGTYSDTIPNIGGCDSVITIQLVIANSTASALTVSGCNSFTAPSGAIYTSSGNYLDTIPNMAGCDSVITIGLQITPLDTTVTPFGVGGLQATQSGATYQWVECSTNTPVAGATQQTFVPSQNGYYYLVITNGSCTDSSACWPAFPIGIEESFASQILLYPNPNTGNFVINLGSTYSDVTIRITDLAGRLVYESIESSASTIPVQLDASAGSYIVSIMSGNNFATFRIIKD